MSPCTSHQDPKGDYVKRWCPELARLPAKYVHSPWTAPPKTLAAAGVELGVTYPRRVIEDLAGARAENVAAIVDVKVAAGEARNDAAGYDLIDLPPGSAVGVKGNVMRLFTVQRYRTPGGRAGGAAASASSGGGSAGRKKKLKAASVRSNKVASPPSKRANTTSPSPAQTSLLTFFKNEDKIL